MNQEQKPKTKKVDPKATEQEPKDGVQNSVAQEQKPKASKPKGLSKKEKEEIEILYDKFIALKHTSIRVGAKPIGKEKESELKKLQEEVNKLAGKKAKFNKTISGGVGVEIKTAEGYICPQHLLDAFINDFKSYHPKKGGEYVKKMLDKYFE
ncbi:MAG: hypothetical protein R3250_04595 [Melioribacteraceae bacterium]|nr:hypothetical protein [Melioribacteraceae bacterium]